MLFKLDDALQLEQASIQHAPGLFSAVDKNRSHLREFLPWVDGMKSEHEMFEYLKSCEILFTEKKEISFVILHDNKCVGRIGLHHINWTNKSAAIGYWLTKDAEGKGIVTRACRWLIDYGFREMGLIRIEIKAAVENIRSQAIPRKLNFKREGVLRMAEFVNDKFVDLTVYSMVFDEWKVNHSEKNNKSSE
jgi:ribosomal-protein-serine acetyltransferase